jgi:hypothetical protein
MEEVTSISVKLANKAYIHLLMALELTTESATEPYIETNPFAYNTATATASRYTSMAFIGIIINISTSRKSTASYSQF